MGLISQALMPLIVGIDAYLMSAFDFLAEPFLWLRTISDVRGTVTASPTFGYDLVTRKASDAQVAELDLSCWKSAYCGAEPISAGTASRFYERFASTGHVEAFTLVTG